MIQGLTAAQEIVELCLGSFIKSSIKEALEQELSTRAHHRIVSISTVAGGDEFNSAIRVVAVIEYL